MRKYIFVTGGVVSSLGKGLTSAAIGALLEARHNGVGIDTPEDYAAFVSRFGPGAS